VQFKGLLTPDGKDGIAKSRHVWSMDNDERPATPLDYLEKVFHVPFHLPPMNSGGFGTLIEQLTKPPDVEQARTETTREEGAADPSGSMGSRADARSVAEGGSKDHASPVGRQDHQMPKSSDERYSEAVRATRVNRPMRSARVLGSVPLQRWERDALKDYHTLIHTPRGATRLLNTYRLVRACLPEDDWDLFRGNQAERGEFRIAMLLLAAAAGVPANARDWFAVLRKAELNPSMNQAQSLDNSQADWSEFCGLYSKTMAAQEPTPSKETISKWLDRVERFAF